LGERPEDAQFLSKKESIFLLFSHMASIESVVAALLPGGEDGSSADDCKDLGNKLLSGIRYLDFSRHSSLNT
jgi:hypothetical protein